MTRNKVLGWQVRGRGWEFFQRMLKMYEIMHGCGGVEMRSMMRPMVALTPGVSIPTVFLSFFEPDVAVLEPGERFDGDPTDG